MVAYVAYDHIGEGDQGAIGVNGYIYSPSRLYFAVLEANGQFNVYAGENPEDPGKVKVWSTNSTVPSNTEVTAIVLRKGPFDQGTKNLQIFMNPRGGSLQQLWASGGSRDLTDPMEGWLGDDGSLILRQRQEGIWKDIWHNGFSDPVVEYKGVTEYDLKNGRHQPNGPPKMASQGHGSNSSPPTLFSF